jgi:pimeloyl-ACP methyl ester carboxylesterase
MFARVASPVLVLLHGLGRSSSDWDHVRPRLDQIGRVVAPDLPRDVGGAREVAAAATVDGAVVIGHSFGAIIAMQLAASPERAVSSVVATSSFFPPALNSRSFPVAVADYGRHRVAFVRERHRASRTGRTTRGAFSGLGFLIRTAASRSSFRAKTDTITCSALVVHAADDHYVPVDFMEAAVARNPTWDGRVLAGGGHYPHIVRPMDWLGVVEPWLVDRHQSGS